MSAAAERRDPIDIEEFERRLRAPEVPEPSRDPLADLARLVAGQGKPSRDPLASIFADAPAQTSAPNVEHDAFAEQARFAQELPDLSQMMRGGFDQGGHEPARSADTRFEPTFDAPAAYERQQPEAYRPSAEYEDWAEQESVPPDASQPAPPAPRSRKPLYLTAAVIGVGLVAIGGTLAWRGGASNPSGVTIIKAASGPTKVQPEAKDGKDVPGQSSTMLDKSVSTPPVKKVVSREEPPMDVAAAEKTPRVIPLGGGDAARTAPVPPPPLQPSQPTPSVFPEPKKVKTVAVRADGTVISSEATKPAQTAPAQPAARNSTPKTDTRAAATPTPQTTPQAARPASPPKPPATTAAAAPKPTPAAVAKPKPQVAAVQPQDEETDDDAAPAKPAAATGGGFGLQLAAAGSEGEARATAQRLGEKYSGALGGRRPSVVKAADKASVWRIRVSGMSRESAVGACEKIKAAGGACIVVH
jgi:hypothetical protein